MREALTPEQARDVELSRNPIMRMGQLAELGAGFNLNKVGWSPLPLYMTRGDLVRAAESRQEAERMLAIVYEAKERSD
jgi:hypothetical protein